MATCRTNCRVFYDARLGQGHAAKNCASGCDFLATGGASFCQCACVSINTEAGMNACLNGCSLGRALTTTSVPQSTQTSPPIHTTRSSSTTSISSVCQDLNSNISVYFETLFGQSVDCSGAKAMGACRNLEFQAVVEKLCPVSCGTCSGYVTEPPKKVDPSSNGSEVAVISGMVILAVLLIVVILAYVFHGRRVKPAFSKSSVSPLSEPIDASSRVPRALTFGFSKRSRYVLEDGVDSSEG